MSRLIRLEAHGQSFFITAATEPDRPLLVRCSDQFLLALVQAHVRQAFSLLGWVLLPDHVHLILQPKRESLSSLMHRIKLAYARQVRGHPGCGHGPLWQRRFREYPIRDDSDFQRHLDYVHYNPVKHGYVREAAEWTLSSLEEYTHLGVYPARKK